MTSKGEHVRGNFFPNLLIFVSATSRGRRERNLRGCVTFFKAHEGTRRPIDSQRGFRTDMPDRKYGGDNKRQVASDSDPLSVGSSESENKGRLGTMGDPIAARSRPSCSTTEARRDPLPLSGKLNSKGLVRGHEQTASKGERATPRVTGARTARFEKEALIHREGFAEGSRRRSSVMHSGIHSGQQMGECP